MTSLKHNFTEDDFVYGESWGLVHRGVLEDKEVERMKALRDKVVGKKGVAQTTLKPIGSVRIDGEVYEARLKTGYLEVGKPIIAVGIDFGYVLVNEDIQEEKNDNDWTYYYRSIDYHLFNRIFHFSTSGVMD